MVPTPAQTQFLLFFNNVQTNIFCAISQDAIRARLIVNQQYSNYMYTSWKRYKTKELLILVFTAFFFLHGKIFKFRRIKVRWNDMT